MKGAMNNIDWSHRWKRLSAACARHRATDRWQEGKELAPRFTVAPPATEGQVRRIEGILNSKIPSGLRRVILSYSCRVDISWQLPDDERPPEPFHQIFSGECRWDLENLPALQKTYEDWTTNCFSNKDNPYDAIWHGKFPIAEVGNGDMIGIDLDQAVGSVVYLSHDDGQGHGYRLGCTFADFLDRFTQVGCPGFEDWQWLPFTDSNCSLINPIGPNAVAWRQWFGLDPEKGDA